MNREPLIDHIPGLRRYARTLTGDAWAADDLVQDTLERACSKWRLWLAGTDLRAWLFTLMHNLFISQIRRAARQGGASQHVDIAEVSDGLRARESDLDRSIDLQRCLMHLPEEQRAVLLLVSLEDMSYEEIAKVTGMPVGTVMSRLSRARARLRELMDGATRPPVASPGASFPTPDGAPILRRLK